MSLTRERSALAAMSSNTSRTLDSLAKAVRENRVDSGTGTILVPSFLSSESSSYAHVSKSAGRGPTCA